MTNVREKEMKIVREQEMRNVREKEMKIVREFERWRKVRHKKNNTSGWQKVKTEIGPFFPLLDSH